MPLTDQQHADEAMARLNVGNHPGGPFGCNSCDAIDEPLDVHGYCERCRDELGQVEFTIDVDWTTRERHADRTFVISTARVLILALDSTDARLGAAQMVGGTLWNEGREGMVVQTRTVYA